VPITAAANVSGGRQLSVLQEGGATANVLVPSAVPVYIEGDGQVSLDYLTLGRQVRIILDLRSGCDLVNFSTIEAGDNVVYFGLETSGADFEAPVVLIVG